MAAPKRILVNNLPRHLQTAKLTTNRISRSTRVTAATQNKRISKWNFNNVAMGLYSL